MKHSILTAVFAGSLVSLAGASYLAAQTEASASENPGPTPRTADGHPDLSGVWWRGADVGGRPAGGGPGPVARRPAGPPPVTFSSLYTPAAEAHAKTLGDKDDPTVHCMPTAFGTLNVSMFDVGAVAQIIQTPKFVVMLTETLHGYQIIPYDGRPHRDDQPPSYRGDAIGRWDGDTFVVDKTNFTDNTWISAEGRVSFHSDALHIIERYRRTNAKTLEIEATLEDSKVLTKPWVVPKQTLTLAPFDQLLQLDCADSTPESVSNAAAAAGPGKTPGKN
jgi:hypothetical protein